MLPAASQARRWAGWSPEDTRIPAPCGEDATARAAADFADRLGPTAQVMSTRPEGSNRRPSWRRDYDRSCSRIDWRPAQAETRRGAGGASADFAQNFPVRSNSYRRAAVDVGRRRRSWRGPPLACRQILPVEVVATQPCEMDVGRQLQEITGRLERDLFLLGRERAGERRAG
jgi:hypothetical protein